jgi:hypothetical protein
MKRTLLDMVQDILNDLEAEEVNTITDTVEAMQVAQTIKSCYLEMMSNRNWPHLKKLIQLESSTDINKPTHLKIPENSKELIIFRYDKRKLDSENAHYEDVKYVYPDEFLRFTGNRSNTQQNRLEVSDYNGVRFYVQTNQAPLYWTSFDDQYVICDAYDRQVDDTLQTIKTQAHVVVYPSWITQDSFVPDLPVEAFSALVEEAKSTAFLNIKQMANEKAEQKATRQNRWLARKAWTAHGGIRYPNYGRTSKK